MTLANNRFLTISVTLILFFFCNNICAQQNKSLHGKVTDANGIAVAGASVYLSHTSKGVTTSNTGEFQLSNLPEGKFDLVISAIGYETKVIAISSENYPPFLNISLAKQTMELAEVVVETVDKNGWRKFGKYFTDNFIGNTRNAKLCKIINPEVIRFRFSDKNNTLTAKANEPIIIENKYLGYKVSFQLIEFRADYNENVVTFYGHPFFMELSESNQTKYRSNRQQAYYGSLMHFMRAVYADNLATEKFTVRAAVSRPNIEKERVKMLLADTTEGAGARYKITQLSGGVVHVSENDKAVNYEDSLRFYNKVLKQRDTINEVVSSIDELITSSRSYSKMLFFKNTMQVVYTGNGKKQLSELMLQTPKPLEVMKNGSYFSPTELVTFKYWSEHEKMCNMLPLDYYPD